VNPHITNKCKIVLSEESWVLQKRSSKFSEKQSLKDPNTLRMNYDVGELERIQETNNRRKEKEKKKRKRKKRKRRQFK
jgi:hypothetical protein